LGFPKQRRRMSLLVVAITAAASLAVIGCGGDDDEEAQRLTVTANAKGALQVADAAEAGLTEITLRNTGKDPADVGFIRVEGDHSAAEVVRVLGKLFSEQGTALPDWFLTAGGTPVAEGGRSETVTQVLEPGTYYAFNFEGLEGPPDPKTVPAIEVTGDAGDAELPETDATVTAEDSVEDYSFEAEGLTAGETTLTFENAGEEPHHLIAAPLTEGSTIEDVQRFVRTEEGKPPVVFDREVGTAVLEGGDSQVVTLDLREGDYALLCFITDRDGGRPHALKGMVSAASVK
jgi:hypothetical protein